MDWRQAWGGVNGRFQDIPSLAAAGGLVGGVPNRIEQSTEQQQQPKRDTTAAQVPIPPAVQAGRLVDEVPAAALVQGREAGATAPATAKPQGGQPQGGQPQAGSAPSSVDAATSGLTPATAGGPRSQEELDLARRRAFLDSKDSLSGARAVRGVLADEVQARGGGERPDVQKESVRSLEERLSKLQGEGNAYLQGIGQELPAAFANPQAFDGLEPLGRDAVMRQMPEGDGRGIGAFATPDAFQGLAPEGLTPEGLTPQVQGPQGQAPAPSGNAAQAGINAWMQTGLRDKLKAEPITTPADWQLRPQGLQAPQTDPWRDAGLAAAAAAGVELPTTEGEAVVRAFGTGPMGSRNGQYKPGNTMPLGFIDPQALPPINSRRTVRNAPLF